MIKSFNLISLTQVSRSKVHTPLRWSSLFLHSKMSSKASFIRWEYKLNLNSRVRTGTLKYLKYSHFLLINNSSSISHCLKTTIQLEIKIKWRAMQKKCCLTLKLKWRRLWLKSKTSRLKIFWSQWARRRIKWSKQLKKQRILPILWQIPSQNLVLTWIHWFHLTRTNRIAQKSRLNRRR
jgi:hypothetical protein